MKKYLQKTYENRFVSIAHNENKKLNSKKSNNSDTRSKTYIRQPGVVVYLRHLKILALASNSSTEESGVQGQPGYIYIYQPKICFKKPGAGDTVYHVQHSGFSPHPTLQRNIMNKKSTHWYYPNSKLIYTQMFIVLYS